MGYTARRKWSDRFIPQIKEILSRYYNSEIKVADYEADNHQATDLIIGDISVGCRVRSHKYLEYNDWSIRRSYTVAAETELAKLKSGYCNVYFYAWTNARHEIVRWVLIDVDKFREFLDYPWAVKHNVATDFITIPITYVAQTGCIITSSGYTNELCIM